MGVVYCMCIFFYGYGDHRDLHVLTHAFPTRRSSDLAYSGPVVHVLDASRAVGVASTLMSDTQRDGFVKTTADEYQTIRDQRANKRESALLSLADARAHATPTDFEAHPPVAPIQPGGHGFKDWTLTDLVASIQ